MCFGQNIWDVIVLLLRGKHKSLYLNSIIFGSPDFTYWNTIGNQRNNSTRYCNLICNIKNSLPDENVGILRRVLTATPSPRPIKIRACLPFYQCSNYKLLQSQWLFHYLNQFYERIFVQSTFKSNTLKWVTVINFSYVFTWYEFWVIIHWCTSIFTGFVTAELCQYSRR